MAQVISEKISKYEKNKNNRRQPADDNKCKAIKLLPFVILGRCV